MGLVSRRQFLEITGTGSLALSLPHFLPSCSKPTPHEPRATNHEPRSYSGYQDLYRQSWTWDSVVKSTHNLNCWYQQNCLFHLYVKDGVVLREEQVADYPQTNDQVPDFNPRGCNKGACYAAMMINPSRLKYPLKRVGPRGNGKWQRVSWDEALGEIAERIVDSIQKDGPDSVVWDPGGNPVSVISFASAWLLSDHMGTVFMDINCEIGDEQQGAAVTYGHPGCDRSADDWFNSDLILVWGGNPVYTQIPNMHFLLEARYNGTKIVSVCPDFSPSSVHTDLWVPVKPGTDAALALSMAHVVVSEKRYNADLIREQTDLPFLVRMDNRKFLRESDMKSGGDDALFHLFDLTGRSVVPARTDTLKLGKILPALEGEFEVETLHGRVKVRPAFELLKDMLRSYDPEPASRICGTPPDLIRKLAHMMADAKAATNVCTSNISKFYHGDLMMRAQILIYVLCGHLGRKGAGYVSASFLLPDGFTQYLSARPGRLARILLRNSPAIYKMIRQGRGWRDAVLELMRETYIHDRFLTNSTLFWYVHGGLAEVSGRSREWDPHLKKDVDEYIREAWKKNWQVVDPRPPKRPNVYWSLMGNPLRRVRSAHKLLEHFFPKLDLIVSTELRMSSTALYSDFVLPVASAYEKTTLIGGNTNSLAPFDHITQKATSYFEAKDEWEIFCALAKHLQRVARERRLKPYVDRMGRERRLDRVFREMTDGGDLPPDRGDKISENVVNASTNLGKTRWKELKEKGYARFTGLGRNPGNWGNACDIKPGETISPHTWFTEKKMPWPTLTGRVQFYIDHDLYLELGEELPVHKDPPKAAGDYPVTLTGGHTRWSIHSTWRSDASMLRLQRGLPVMYVNGADARRRGVRDGDRVTVRNDIGSFVIMAKTSPAVRPGQAMIYHAWENYQFEGGMGYRNVLPSPINPIELVGDYGHIRPVPAILQPGQSDRDTRIDYRRVMGHGP
ncbi:MAG: molybdopterin-dependent oxidoreductase [Nitrospirae bacterium]|nr:molybdopterin-dependent oxidoreductase [Nitrospirota bacterium]